jgi:hypothetical protein
MITEAEIYTVMRKHHLTDTFDLAVNALIEHAKTSPWKWRERKRLRVEVASTGGAFLAAYHKAIGRELDDSEISDISNMLLDAAKFRSLPSAERGRELNRKMAKKLGIGPYADVT